MGKNLIEVLIRADDQASGKMNALAKSFKASVDGIHKASGMLAIAGAGVLTGIGALVYKTAEWGEAMNDAALRLGMSTEFVSGLSYALRLAGGDLAQFQVSMKGFANAIDAANQKYGKQNSFTRLGIDVRDSSGYLKNSEQLIFEVADAISKLGNAEERNAILTDLFGRSALVLGPIMLDGAAGIRTVMAEANRLGVTLSGKSGKALDELSDSAQRIKESFRGAAIALTIEFAPELTKFSDNLARNTIPKMTEWIRKHNEVVTGSAKVVGGLTLLNAGIWLTSGAIKVLIPLLGVLAAHPAFVAIGLGVTAAILFDKTLHAIGIGNPLQNIIDGFAAIASNAKAAREETERFKGGMVTVTGVTVEITPTLAPGADAVMEAVRKKYADVPGVGRPMVPLARDFPVVVPRGISPEMQLANEEKMIAQIKARKQEIFALTPAIIQLTEAEKYEYEERMKAARASLWAEAENEPARVNAMAEQAIRDAESFRASFDYTMTDAASAITQTLGNAFASLFDKAENRAQAWGNLMRSLVSSIASSLVQMATWKWLMLPLFFNQGGEVAGAQRGLETVGTSRGRDTIPAMLSSGEAVIPSPTVERLNRFMDRNEGGGGGMNLYTLFYSGSREEANQAGSYILNRERNARRFVVQGAL